MKRILFSGLYFVLFFLAGCIVFRYPYPWKDVPESRVYPYYTPRFKILPQALAPENALLDCSAVYASKFQGYKDGDKLVPDTYAFFRFWPSGHVYLRYLTHIPDSADADDFHRAHMGFYNLSGTNITIELYWAEWGYAFDFGHIEEDKIVIDKTGRRSPTGRLIEVEQCTAETYADGYFRYFYRYPIKGLSRLPDWSPTGMLWQSESYSGGAKR